MKDKSAYTAYLRFPIRGDTCGILQIAVLTSRRREIALTRHVLPRSKSRSSRTQFVLNFETLAGMLYIRRMCSMSPFHVYLISEDLT